MMRSKYIIVDGKTFEKDAYEKNKKTAKKNGKISESKKEVKTNDGSDKGKNADTGSGSN